MDIPEGETVPSIGNTLFLIEKLIENLPPKGAAGWTTLWENLKGWVHGVGFFIGPATASLHEDFQNFCDALDRFDFPTMMLISQVLQKHPEIVELSRNEPFLKEQMLEALETFRHAFPPTVLKVRWLGFLDSLRVAVSLGSPVDQKWAGLVLAYQQFYADSNKPQGVIQAVEDFVEVLG